MAIRDSSRIDIETKLANTKEKWNGAHDECDENVRSEYFN